ncbi:hypothetical protein WA026_010605 [Henosepilachna vigintioctopunctata]|uniref:Uncharacterized protein n=1 Tax=Henosepilachna vigintioctopunctata TaxID=420089 RepID=A0AAW1VBN7_9CUCU
MVVSIDFFASFLSDTGKRKQLKFPLILSLRDCRSAAISVSCSNRKASMRHPFLPIMWGFVHVFPASDTNQNTKNAGGSKFSRSNRAAVEFYLCPLEIS